MVCTCIDTEGQARTADWKLRAATAIHDLAVERYGLAPEDLLFDPLVLPICRPGMEESRRDGIETIEGIRRIKAELPGVGTIVGLSNVSFGLNPAARHVLNSVFLHECQEAGLDAAIVHAARILPLHKIDAAGPRGLPRPDLRPPRPGERLRPAGRAARRSSRASQRPTPVDARTAAGWPVERRLEQRIIDGDRNGLEADLDEALADGWAALDIVNDLLLAGMKTVGELFGSGRDAAAVRAAVGRDHEDGRRLPRAAHGEGRRTAARARIVLATVKGDVHDIGKNLVDIILTNNGYEVHNLGIKVPLADMLDAAEEIEADAIGMSGLLVKCTLIMRENLEELNEPGPVRHPGHPRRRRPDAHLRRAGPPRRCTRAASSTARTPSRACAPWTG